MSAGDDCEHEPAYLVAEFIPAPSVRVREYRCARCGVIYSVETDRFAWLYERTDTPT